MKRLLVVSATLIVLMLPASGALAQSTHGSVPVQRHPMVNASAPCIAPSINPLCVQRNPVVSGSVHNDVSPPLRNITPRRSPTTLIGARPLRRLPRPQAGGTTAAVQSSGYSATRRAPITGLNFGGVGNGFSGPAGSFTVTSAPPDTNGAAGPNHFFQIVNQSFAIFNKSGTAVYGPAATNTVFSGFGGGCEANDDGDATVSYDRISDRWVISQFSVSTTPYLQCVAVSQTGDPTGSYYRYSFQYSDFPDYPKLGVWPDGYYITFNMFAGGSTFSGGEVCAYDRSKMLAGQAATQQCFNVGTSYGGLLPSDLDGSRQPPAGSPNYVVALGASANQLAAWKFHVDFGTPANTTLTGPSNLATAAFSEACGGGTCIPQSGTSQQLDSLADRLMYRLAYRNFGDHESLVVDHSVTAGSSTGIRWYELRISGGSPTIYQQGTYAPDSSYRWMGSIAMDQAGNMALGYSVSSSSIHPQIHYTGRLAGDAAGTMTQGENTLINGAGSQGTSLSRWGDYSSMSIDPTDDCTFWYTNEYIPSNGTFNWSTQIGSFKLSGCGGPPTPDFSLSASPSSQTVAAGSSTSYSITITPSNGFTGSVNLSVSGLPSGATGSFSPNPTTSSSTLSVTTASSTPAGTYSLTVTGTSGSLTHTTSVSLTVTGAAGSITNGGFETGDFTGWTRAGTTSISTTAHTGTHSAQVGSTSPTNGDSSISQTFTASSSGGTLSFWYQIHCPDTVTYDWATATLQDTTTGATTTLLAKTCTNAGSWVQSSPANVTGGHSYTLTLISHDDNYATDPTYTLFDDVAIASNTPADFTISANPTSLSIAQGASGTSTISTTVVGSAGTVNLSASVSAGGPSVSLNPTSVAAGNNSTLTVSPSCSVNPGNYTVTVTGTEGSMTHTTQVAVTVTATTPDFSISANPTSLTVAQGGSGTSTISTGIVGCGGNVNLSASVSPAGPTASLSPTSVAAGGSSTLTVSVGSTVATGTYTVTVTGTEGSFTHSTPVSVTVTASDFTISASPASLTISQGSSGTSTISTAAIGSPGTVSLSAGVSPSGPTASLSPTSVTAGGSSTLTVSVGSSVATGTYNVTVTGTEGSATHNTTVSVTVTSGNAIVNGGFETGNFSGWTTSGATSISTTAHSGSRSAQVGSANPFNGDSSISQTFTAPSGTGHTLSFWYRVVCTDSVQYDWATATLKDNTAGTTTTVLPKTCTNSGAWVQKTVNLTGGHSYTLTLIDHDDNWSSPPDPTYTLYDDIVVT